MAQYEFQYAIFRNDQYLADSTTTISLTKKDIKALEDFVVEHEFSPLFVDIPAYIYDKCNRKAWDEVPRLCEEIGDSAKPDGLELAFTDHMPLSFIETLDEEIAEKVYEKLQEIHPEFFEGDEETEEEGADAEVDLAVTFELSVENLSLVMGRGVVLEGVVQFGKCKVGDVGLVLDAEGNIIAESTVSNIECGRKILMNLDEFEETEGMPIGILTSIKSKKELKGAATFVVEAEEDVEEEGEEDEEFEIPDPCKANTLYLPIKQVFFDQIMDGSKKEEYREITATTYKKYLECDKDGYVLFDTEVISEEELESLDPQFELNFYNNGECPFIPKENLWYLNLAVGYNKVRDTALVQVVEMDFQIAKREDGSEVRFTVDEEGNICDAPEENTAFGWPSFVLAML